VGVVGIRLFIVGFGGQGLGPLLLGGVIIGIGIASMHYMGMFAMRMPDTMSYNSRLVTLSVAIAIVAGTAALWAGTQVRGVAVTIAASLIMGVAVSGMHYTGMAAMRVSPGSMSAMGGSTAASFLVPLLLGISLVTFVLTIIISLSPTEDEIKADALLQHRMDTEFSADRNVVRIGTPGETAAQQLTPPRPGGGSSWGRPPRIG